MLSAFNVTLEFPVYGITTRSLRRAVLGLNTGGRMGSRGGDRLVVQALKGVTFQLQEGDRLGIIGHNGSGKSSLLRCIAGIYRPTAGRLETRGHVSTFFDVGLGLDPEATGRENVELLGLYRGRSKAEIRQAMEEVIDFSGLGAFIDLPLKTYSSGMAGRLVFSVATSFQPDILLMDEWLSAGDADFLSRAEKRVTGLIENVRCMVFASHSTDHVRRFCNKVLVLDHGEVARFGPTDEILSASAAA